ncbi:GGDEF domain-containing protein [Zoogloea sp. LCSB751]|uniref:GGDEF domain-containing protein n=1 Tax=Zoogloea sp. LCSB751 TaxID=1965277 RepID=UPI0009A4A3F7|nr:GGDEF domain-containing protein [Zoogloea sp. LCSB751]
MPHTPRLAAETWQRLAETSSDAIRAAVTGIIERDRAELADRFYEQMLADPGAVQFLSAQAVEAHLKPGLQRWMEMLFCHRSVEELVSALALQRHVGEVHARAQIPVQLVARGFRFLKQAINARLIATELGREALVHAVLYVDHLTDIAFEEMSSAFILSAERSARTDEAYKMHEAGRNLALEREKQSVAILEWEARVYRLLASGAPFDDMPTLLDSEFGLWLHHKAPLLFEDTRELPLIEACVEHIDQSLFPRLSGERDSPADGDGNRTLTRAVLVEIEELKYLLRNMFDHIMELEVGRDVLTHLFNRRFLPSIMRREISLARKHDCSFCVLMMDIDHFKRINDEHGHDAGDRVLQQVAALIVGQLRAGDFVFRYGGEEFLAVLAEIDLPKAVVVAEKIRQRIADSDVFLAGGETLRVTMSIGLAGSDGHPDYQRLIDRADKALYAAKEAGRNRVATD